MSEPSSLSSAACSLLSLICLGMSKVERKERDSGWCLQEEGNELEVDNPQARVEGTKPPEMDITEIPSPDPPPATSPQCSEPVWYWVASGLRPGLVGCLECYQCPPSYSTLRFKTFLIIVPDPFPATPPPGSLSLTQQRPCFSSGLPQPTSGHS